jgi:rhodanese-related sulfurtransferase
MQTDTIHRLANARDVGGLPTATGSHVRHGLLLRSDAPLPDDAPPEGLAWPPTLVLDLRSPSETGPVHPLARPGTTVLNLPLLADADPSRMISAPTPPSLPDLYTAILAEAVAQLDRILELITTADGPVLVHCAAGKDRTGVLVALLLAAVGVPRAEIEADYQRTAANMGGVLERVIRARPPQLQETVRVRIASTPPELLGTPTEALSVVLDQLDAHPGAAVGWLRERGVSAELLAALSRRLVQ